MLWLAVHLPALPLEVFSRTLPADRPTAVTVHEAGPCILLCNGPAAAGGVRPGLAVGAAQALVAGLQLVARDIDAEQAALRRLAAWAGQYTPQISLEHPQTLFLEVSGSLRLFGGVEVILTRLRDGLAHLGYTVRLAVAPTPQGALSLARAGRQTVIRDPHALRSALAPLPLHRLPFDRQLLVALQHMGLQRLADLLRLPRQGLRRRLGGAYMDYLDRLLGRIPDPRPLFRPPPGFSGRITLPAEVEGTEALLFGCRRLILEMCGYLSALDSGTQCLAWTLGHPGKAHTRFSLRLVKPGREPDHLLGLLRERLERVELVAPVLGIGLTAGDIQPLDMTSADLFAAVPAASGHDPHRLLERLRARLGDEAVRGLQLFPEHRPERAWAYCTPGESAKPLDFGRRPLWLLPRPEPLEVRDGWPWRNGRLELEPERERIESGWWDGEDVARDYFVARSPDGERLWIYRELHGQRRWFLHGFA